VPTANRRAAEAHRRRTVDHYEYLWLRCTRCNERQELVMPADADHHLDWTIKPVLDCPHCGFTAPSPNFRVTFRVHGTAAGV
jgi:DNA-directed RNA polymerase subunit RPC12/RpoP